MASGNVKGRWPGEREDEGGGGQSGVASWGSERTEIVRESMERDLELVIRAWQAKLEGKDHHGPRLSGAARKRRAGELDHGLD